MRAHAGENPAAVDSSELQQVSTYVLLLIRYPKYWGNYTASLTNSQPLQCTINPFPQLEPLASGKQASARKTWLLDGKINGECCEVIGYMADTSQVLSCSATRGLRVNMHIFVIEL